MIALGAKGEQHRAVVRALAGKDPTRVKHANDLWARVRNLARTDPSFEVAAERVLLLALDASNAKQTLATRDALRKHDRAVASTAARLHDVLSSHPDFGVRNIQTTSLYPDFWRENIRKALGGRMVPAVVGGIEYSTPSARATTASLSKRPPIDAVLSRSPPLVTLLATLTLEMKWLAARRMEEAKPRDTGAAMQLADRLMRDVRDRYRGVKPIDNARIAAALVNCLGLSHDDPFEAIYQRAKRLQKDGH